MNQEGHSYEHYRRIIEHCLETYARQRNLVARRRATTASELDFELFLAAYRAMEIDGASDEREELLLAAFAEYLGWPPDKVDALRDRADRQRLRRLSDFVLLQAYPELGVTAFKLAYAMSRIDGTVHEDEAVFIANLKAHLFSGGNRSLADQEERAVDSLFDGGHAAGGSSPGGGLPGSDIGTNGEPVAAKKEDRADDRAAGEDAPPEENLDDCLSELHDLVGLRPVKEEIERLVRFLQVQQKRRDYGLPVQRISLHMVFTGNPGTGKTTVGRLVSRLFRAMGILASGHLVETDRSGLVGSYVGHTAPKTLEVARKALDGVLFVDEAYALTRGSDSDFGKEAIDTLVKFMEDHRDRLVVIVAGYQDEMRAFIASNPGLKSRFATVIHFPDYTVRELAAMFERLCERNGYELTPEAHDTLARHLEDAVASAQQGFGNGRHVRNLFEDAIKNQAFRLVAGDADVTKENLVELLPEDIVSR